MITNERQYKITNKQLARLREAIEKFDIAEAANRVGSTTLANAELAALMSEKEVLEAQLLEYEALQTGNVVRLEAASLDELPKMLIRARIAQQLSQRKLAERLGMKEQQIQRYESEEYGSASLRRIYEVAEALGLAISETAKLNLPPSNENAKRVAQLDWTKFPIKEMYKRGWFEGFTGSLDEAMRQTEELVRSCLPPSLLDQPTGALYRKSVRSSVEIDPYALLAWEGRVLSLASRDRRIRPFQRELVTDEWISKLVRTSFESDGPARAKQMLREVGIPLVIEPYLANTSVDGAALLGNESPVIGMTLLHERLDNFWFVLLHELFHILKHLRRGRLEVVVDDLEEASSEDIEQEADRLAAEALIPSQVWNTALARYVRTPEAIRQFASKLHISPAIVAGRIRREANNYVMLNELVGYNEVKKHFPEVPFRG